MVKVFRVNYTVEMHAVLLRAAERLREAVRRCPYPRMFVWVMEGARPLVSQNIRVGR